MWGSVSGNQIGASDSTLLHNVQPFQAANIAL